MVEKRKKHLGIHFRLFLHVLKKGQNHNLLVYRFVTSLAGTDMGWFTTSLAGSVVWSFVTSLAVSKVSRFATSLAESEVCRFSHLFHVQGWASLPHLWQGDSHFLL